ncbi:hypothetical protein [Geodermatophilus sp. SYSU D01176]
MAAQWTDPASEVDVDQLLTDVAVYWFTRTGPSSAQLYWERAHTGARLVPGRADRRGGAAARPLPAAAGC